MSAIEKVYAVAPTWAQNVLCSAEGLRLSRWRYGRLFDEALSAAEERARLPPEKLLEARDRRLRDFVARAFQTVPYYRELAERERLRPEEIRGLQDLSKLPLLDPSTVRRRTDAFYAELPPDVRTRIAHTSGTTGSGMRFPVTRALDIEQFAVFWRFWRWHGITRRDWCGYFGGRTIVPARRRSGPFWRINRPARQVMFSAFHLNVRNIEGYLTPIRERGLRWLHGYPSQLALLAELGLAAGAERPASVEAITTGSESLLDHQKRAIREFFGVAPVELYAQAESVAVFSELPDGGLAVDEDFSAVEFLPVGDGMFEIVGTNFCNAAFPLIRYRTGDLVACDGELPRVAGSLMAGARIVPSVDGRREDYVELPDGTRVGRLDHVFKDLTSIREAQLAQIAAGVLEVRIVPGDAYGEHTERVLREQLRSRLGDAMELRILPVDRVSRAARGKLRFVVDERSPGPT